MTISKMHKRLLTLGATASVATAGAFLIIPYEGSVKDGDIHVVYLDAVGVPTACYGQTQYDLYGRRIKLGMSYTEDECLEMYVITGKKFEVEIDRVFGDIPYQNTYQKAGLLSFTYNVGTTNLRTSTLVKKFKNKDYDAACDQLSRWVYANKKKLNGLVTRRSEEKAWCLAEQHVIDRVEYTLGHPIDGPSSKPLPPPPPLGKNINSGKEGNECLGTS